MTPSGLLDAARNVLQGEPARAIGYGAAVIIYLVANVVGSIPDQSLDQSLVLAVGYVGMAASIVESIRHFVTPVASLPASDTGDTT